MLPSSELFTVDSLPVKDQPWILQAWSGDVMPWLCPRPLNVLKVDLKVQKKEKEQNKK